MRRGALFVVLVVAAAVTLGVVGTPTAPAGGVPEAGMSGLFEAVSDGGLAAYTSTFVHDGKSQTHVRYHNPIPANADFEAASCEGQEIAGEFVCDPIKLKKGVPVTVTIVLRGVRRGLVGLRRLGAVPDQLRLLDERCRHERAPRSRRRSPTWAQVETPFLGDNDERAATYALGECDPEGDPTVATNPLLDRRATRSRARSASRASCSRARHGSHRAGGGGGRRGGRDRRLCRGDELRSPVHVRGGDHLHVPPRRGDGLPGRGAGGGRLAVHAGDPRRRSRRSLRGRRRPDPCADITSVGGITTVLAKGTENGLWVVD